MLPLECRNCQLAVRELLCPKPKADGHVVGSRAKHGTAKECANSNLDFHWLWLSKATY